MKKARKVKVWLAAGLALIVFVLVIQNTETVTVSILFWDLKISMVVLIPFVFLVGMVVGYVIRLKR